jgi:hypothetical protein
MFGTWRFTRRENCILWDHAGLETFILWKMMAGIRIKMVCCPFPY